MTSRLLNADDIKKPSKAMIFCIEGLEEYANFGSLPSIMSGHELVERVRGNSM